MHCKNIHVYSVVPADISAGRHLAVYTAAQQAGDFVHYIDFDRMLRWLETQPEEVSDIHKVIPQYACLIIGRSPEALATHAQALQQTEAITNAVVSFLLGQSVDTGGGSRALVGKPCTFYSSTVWSGTPSLRMPNGPFSCSEVAIQSVTAQCMD